jgi:hypothetical protein
MKGERLLVELEAGNAVQVALVVGTVGRIANSVFD